MPFACRAALSCLCNGNRQSAGIAVRAKVVHAGERLSLVLCCKAVERERCNSLYGVTDDVLSPNLPAPDFKQRDLSSLRTGIIAGASVPMELMRA